MPVRIVDRADRAGVATVDARLAIEHLVADDLGFDVAEDVLDRALVGGLGGVRTRSAMDTGLEFVHALRTGLLLLDAVGVAKIGARDRFDCRDQRFVAGGRDPVPQRLAGLFHQLELMASITACICW
jgi:hypothetical protein